MSAIQHRNSSNVSEMIFCTRVSPILVAKLAVPCEDWTALRAPSCVPHSMLAMSFKRLWQQGGRQPELSTAGKQAAAAKKKEP